MSKEPEKRKVVAIRAFPSLIERSRRAARKRNQKHVDWMDEAIREKLERKSA